MTGPDGRSDDSATGASVPTAPACLRAALVAAALLSLADTVAASNAAVGVQSASRDAVQVPRWLYVTTGGAAIGASAVLASLVTDRAYIRSLHRWRRVLPAGAGVRSIARRLGPVVGLALTALVVYTGFYGPPISTISFAILAVFVGVRAGLTMLTYAAGDWWRVLNPWRAIAARLPNGFLDYPDRLDAWPAVAGLLALIWVETTTGVTTEPSTLAAAVCVYSAVTLAGAVAFSPSTWFRNVDPVSTFFRMYARVAPIRWGRGGGLELELPGSRLVREEVIDGWADVAFVIAMIWELTFSGFVTTAVGAATVRAFVDAGVPSLAVYLTLYLGGYAAFFGAYRYAAVASRRLVPTYLSVRTLATRFAPPLLAIAAGYHLAHYFAFFVSLAPSLFGVLASPLAPPANPLVLVLPSWFGGLNIAFVLLGHLLAVWLAHATAYELFPRRMDAIRSQYSFVAVMIGYTAVSLWLISLPTAQPAGLG